MFEHSQMLKNSIFAETEMKKVNIKLIGLKKEDYW